MAANTNVRKENDTKEDDDAIQDVDIDSESDDDDNSDDENAELIIEDLTSKISVSPYQYDLHLQLIQLLGSQGELEKLREAREHMSQIFPLTEALWLEWINDEKKWSEGESGRAAILALFERAVKDYLSPGVWLEYTQYCMGDVGSEEGVTRARDVCERAVAAVGLHLSKGALIWEVYREFECALLVTMQPLPGSIPTKEQEDKLEGQTNRIDSLFKRQLRVPLQSIEHTLAEYESWLGESASEEVKQNFSRAFAQLQKLQPYEDALDVDDHSQQLQEYKKYLEFVKANSNPATIQCLFERAVQDKCLVSDLWIDYTNYLDNQLKIPSVVLDVYRRSVANCPWCLKLWQGYLRALEKHRQPKKVVDDVFEKSLLGGFPHSSNYLDLWLSYIDYLRRRIDWSQDFAENLEDFRAAIDRATEHLSQYFGGDGDPMFSLQQYRARIEAKHCQNMEKAREIWNDILAAGLGNQAQLWMDYFNLERSFGDTKHCRKILHRAVNAVSDWPETVCTALLNFEREEGTLETFESAMRRVESQMKRVKEQRDKQQAPDYSKWADRQKYKRHSGGRQDRGGYGDGKKGLGWKQKKRGNDTLTTERRENLKRKVTKGEKEDSSKVKKVKFVHEGENKGDEVFKIPAIPALSPSKRDSHPTPTETSHSIPAEASPQISAETAQPIPAQTVKKEEPDEAMDVTEVSSSTKKEEKELDLQKQSLTVFLKNLSYDATKESIQDFMSKCGEIKEVRMVCNYQQKFRGFCYVEFTSEDSVENAVKMDRELFQGRHIYIDRYIEKKKSQKPKMDFKYEQKMERNKLFLSNLPRSATKEDLQKLFQKYGPLKDVRLVTYKSGVSKGLAYVEFENEADAAKAVIGADQTKMADHSINVAISNPPTRKQPAKDMPDEVQEEMPKPLGAKGAIGPRGKGRTQLSMVPRAIKKPAAVPKKPSAPSKSSTDVTSSSGEDTKKEEVVDGKGEGFTQPGKMLSNADFAKMLLKK